MPAEHSPPETAAGVGRTPAPPFRPAGPRSLEVASDQGKSVEGLKAAILAGAKNDLDAAVAAGKFTAAQEQTMLNDLESHLDDLVNGRGLVEVTATA